MGKRNSRRDTPENEAEPTLHEMEAKITRMHWGWQNGGTSQARKAFFKSLVELESQREALFGIPAPYRRFGR